MADVTDAAFRSIIAKYGKPDVMYTELVSADGLVLAPEEGRRKLLKDLEYSEAERPIVAQFFTSKPENMEKAARLAVELGFDGVDINMGCPDKSVEKQGSGAALIKNAPLARELIKAAKQGVQDKIPVSVKTRLGYNKDELEEWLPELLAESPAAIIIHARTRKEMSKVPARWERIKRAVEIRDEVQKDSGLNRTLILGNGDLIDTNDAINKCNETGTDGAMLGRAIFGNPFLFANREKKRPERSEGHNLYTPTPEEKLRVLIEHTKLFEQKFALPTGGKSFSIMKKHFKAYIKDFDGANELRIKLMETNNAKEVEDVINDYLASN